MSPDYQQILKNLMSTSGPKNKHFSPRTQKWEDCSAKKGNCRYKTHKIFGLSDGSGSITNEIIDRIKEDSAKTFTDILDKKTEAPYPQYVSDSSSILKKPYKVLNSLNRKLQFDDNPAKPNPYRVLASYISSNPMSEEFEKKLDKLIDKLEDENFHGEAIMLASAKALHRWSFTGEVPRSASVLRGLDLTDPRSSAFIKDVKTELLKKELAWREEGQEQEALDSTNYYLDLSLSTNTSLPDAKLAEQIKTNNNFGAILSQSVELIRRKGRKAFNQEVLEEIHQNDHDRYRYLKTWLGYS